MPSWIIISATAASLAFGVYVAYTCLRDMYRDVRTAVDWVKRNLADDSTPPTAGEKVDAG